MKSLAMVPLPAGRPSGGMSIFCTERRIGLKETMIRFMSVPISLPIFSALVLIDILQFTLAKVYRKQYIVQNYNITTIY